MKRDMDLLRKILFKVEDEIGNTAKVGLTIDEYSMEQVSYHCRLLYESGLIREYESLCADNGIYAFIVGSLTSEGHDFLDEIRNDTVWNKTKEVIKEKALPEVVSVIKEIATTFVSAAVEGAIRANK